MSDTTRSFDRIKGQGAEAGVIAKVEYFDTEMSGMIGHEAVKRASVTGLITTDVGEALGLCPDNDKVNRIQLFLGKYWDGKLIAETQPEALTGSYLVGELITDPAAELERIRPQICVLPDMIYAAKQFRGGMSLEDGEKVNAEGRAFRALDDQMIADAVQFAHSRGEMTMATQTYQAIALMRDGRARYRPVMFYDGIVSPQGVVQRQPNTPGIMPKFEAPKRKMVG